MNHISHAIETLDDALEIDLEILADQIPAPARIKFLTCCEAFVISGNPIEPLPFCTFLRKNGWPAEAKALCHFFIQNNPGALSRTLAA